MPSDRDTTIDGICKCLHLLSDEELHNLLCELDGHVRSKYGEHFFEEAGKVKMSNGLILS